AIPKRQLHPIVRGGVVGIPRLHGLVEGVNALNGLLRSTSREVARLGEQRGRAADWSAGVVLVGEVLPAPSLVEEIAEVENVEPELEVLLSERPQRLADAHI